MTSLELFNEGDTILDICRGRLSPGCTATCQMQSTTAMGREMPSGPSSPLKIERVSLSFWCDPFVESHWSSRLLLTDFDFIAELQAILAKKQKDLFFASEAAFLTEADLKETELSYAQFVQKQVHSDTVYSSNVQVPLQDRKPTDLITLVCREIWCSYPPDVRTKSSIARPYRRSKWPRTFSHPNPSHAAGR